MTAGSGQWCAALGHPVSMGDRGCAHAADVVRAKAVTVVQVKRLAMGLGALLLLALGAWVRFLASDRLLSGIVIGSVAVPSERRAAERVLRREADLWAGSELAISLGEGGQVRSLARGALGASLPVEAIFASAAEVGRSGNPFVDLGKWWQAQRGQLKLRWTPEVDRAQLAAFVAVQQQRAERLPVAGVTDGQGFTLPGRDGAALDHATAMAQLERALAGGADRVLLPLQRVPAPAPIELGSPDGALFEGDEPVAEPPMPAAPAGPVPEPSAWLPATDDDCYEQPRHFCDGPRKVPAPHGPAQALAERLGLGKLETVARLIRQGPTAAWVSAAGGPSSDAALTWPVPQGKLGRGFGFVRRPELRDRIHAGIDIVAARGSVVRAAAAGIVAYSDNRVRGYGNLLAIVHDNGAVTLSAHCQRILVFAGERVARGQVVAELGMTGLAMGPHLHFEYHVGHQATDPEPHFVDRAAPDRR
jgi:hypothetical protein